MASVIGFDIIHRDPHSQARRGILRTPHGTAQTPSFMPVGTAGAVKGIMPEQLRQLGAETILANAYHFMIRPGVEIVEKVGGLHRFMAWDGPILTDSGGYQGFSLSKLNRIDAGGVEFASHIDGKSLYLNPEIATHLQNRLAADIIMCFDQCTHFPCAPAELESAVGRTIRWAGECKSAHGRPDQMLFGIVQGGIDLTLRSRCAEALVDLDFPGYAIGGLSVGEGHHHMVTTVQHTAPLLPADKPRYLMGVGTPADLIASVQAGVDMFDCVLPTRNGRNAFAFRSEGPLRLRNSEHADSREPIDSACECYCCRHFTRAALRHFFNDKEMLGPILVTLHNLTFFQRLMAQMRALIEADAFSSWAQRELPRYRALYHA